MPGDDITTGELGRRIDSLTGAVEDVRGMLLGLGATYVTKGEQLARNTDVDNRFLSLGREVGDLRTEVRSKRAPWWSVASVAVAALALLWSMFGASI